MSLPEETQPLISWKYNAKIINNQLIPRGYLADLLFLLRFYSYFYFFSIKKY